MAIKQVKDPVTGQVKLVNTGSTSTAGSMPTTPGQDMVSGVSTGTTGVTLRDLDVPNAYDMSLTKIKGSSDLTGDQVKEATGIYLSDDGSLRTPKVGDKYTNQSLGFEDVFQADGSIVRQKIGSLPVGQGIGAIDITTGKVNPGTSLKDRLQDRINQAKIASTVAPVTQGRGIGDLGITPQEVATPAPVATPVVGSFAERLKQRLGGQVVSTPISEPTTVSPVTLTTIPTVTSKTLSTDLEKTKSDIEGITKQSSNLITSDLSNIQSRLTSQDVIDARTRTQELQASKDALDASNASAELRKQADVELEKSILDYQLLQKQKQEELLRQDLEEDKLAEQASAERDRKYLNLLGSITGSSVFTTRLLDERLNSLKSKQDQLEKVAFKAIDTLWVEATLLVASYKKSVASINAQVDEKLARNKSDYLKEVRDINTFYSNRDEKRLQLLLDATKSAQDKYLETQKWGTEMKIKAIQDTNDNYLKLEETKAKKETEAVKGQVKNQILENVIRGIASIENVPSDYKAEAESIYNQSIQNSKLITTDSNNSTLPIDQYKVDTGIKDQQGNPIIKSVDDIKLPQAKIDTIYKDQAPNLEILNGKGGQAGTQTTKKLLAQVMFVTKKYGNVLQDPKKMANQNIIKEYEGLVNQLMLSIKDSVYGLGALTGSDAEYLNKVIGGQLSDPKWELWNLDDVKRSGVTNATINVLSNLYNSINSKEDVVAKTVENRYGIEAYAKPIRDQFINIGSRDGSLEQIKSGLSQITPITGEKVPGLDEVLGTLGTGGSYVSNIGSGIGGFVTGLLTKLK